MNDPLMNKLPPQALEIEESVLCSCLMDSNHLEEALDLLEPNDFYRTAHRIIFKTIGFLKFTHGDIDLPLLVTKLREDDALEKVGGATYISRLLDAPMATNIEEYCRKIREKAALRRTIEICNAVTKRCLDDRGNAAEIIDRFQNDINSIQIEQSGEDIQAFSELMEAAPEKYQELYENKGMLTGIDTGYHELNEYTAGWQKSDLIILAGRPSMGKSSLAENMALNSKTPTLFYSIEMSKDQLRDKAVSIDSGVNSHKFRSGRFSKEDWNYLTESAKKLHSYPIWIDDRGNLTPLEIKRTTRKYKQKHNIGLVVIDYLQLIQGGAGENRNLELGDITRTMKIMAKELHLPVIVLSQLNRNLENRTDKRPRLSDLRESGNIEQDADVVCFIYRPRVYNEEEKFEQETQLILAKQRNGPTGTARVGFRPETTEFYNVDYYHDEDGQPF